jgi:predicted lipid-binding transport protein (Tim44 family)
LAGVLFGLIPLAGLLLVFVVYYDLGFVRAFLTIIVMGIMLHLLGGILVDILGDLDDSTAGIWAAVMVGGIVGAFVLRKKGIIGGTPEQQFEKFDKKRRGEQMPTARAKIKTSKKSAKAATAKPKAEPIAEPTPAPAAAKPAKPEPASEVPPQPEHSSLDDGPTFLT